MPKAARKSTSSSSSCSEPYSKTSPKNKSKSTEDKENVNPNHYTTSKSSRSSSKPSISSSKKSNPTSDLSHWRTIPLEVKAGEIPCYDDASTIRRKLKKLVESKEPIPGGEGGEGGEGKSGEGKKGKERKWSNTTLADEMRALEEEMGAVRATDPDRSAGLNAGQVGKFLKKGGRMGGGDSPVYYWGNVVLEKLRVAGGERKGKGRVEAEER